MGAKIYESWRDGLVQNFFKVFNPSGILVIFRCQGLATGVDPLYIRKVFVSLLLNN